jgi:hypothetical protein
MQGQKQQCSRIHGICQNVPGNFFCPGIPPHLFQSKNNINNFYQYSQYETEVNHVITLSNFNKYMGSREGCFTGETDFIQLTNDVLAQLKNLKDPETVLSKGSRPTLENDGAITEVQNKGSV